MDRNMRVFGADMMEMDAYDESESRLSDLSAKS
jgi:hypothetical protein